MYQGKTFIYFQPIHPTTPPVISIPTDPHHCFCSCSIFFLLEKFILHGKLSTCWKINTFLSWVLKWLKTIQSYRKMVLKHISFRRNTTDMIRLYVLLKITSKWNFCFRYLTSFLSLLLPFALFQMNFVVLQPR